MTPPATAKKPALASVTPRKRRVFILIALLLPVLLLLAVEGVLRLRGHGGYAPLLHPVGQVEGGSLILADIAGAATWFYANPSHPGYNNQYQFIDPKPKDTFRIFVVGESAAKGFPQPRNLASSAFLERVLTDAWPDRRVEVINLGTTAVASFPVLGMMTEALAYEPDLIIIHTGHNEFFGAYGVGSVSRGAAGVKRLETTRFLNSLAITQAASKALRSGDQARNQSLMEIMMEQTYTAHDDPIRNSAADNLGANIREMLDRCNEQDIPAIVCTLPTNERDLFPVGDDRNDQLAPDAREEFTELLQQGEQLLADKPSQALKVLDQTTALHPTHARSRALLGRALFETGDKQRASQEFIIARDYDTMPWRATSIQQKAIRDATKSAGAVICDLEEVFRSESPGRCIGWELMDDHVHPNLQGQALTADALTETIRGMDRLPPVPDGMQPAMKYATELGANPYDAYAIDHTMRALFSVPFLNERNAESLKRSEDRATEFEKNLSPGLRDTIRKWQSVRPHVGGKRPITGMVARQMMRERRFEEAQSLYRIARRSVPEYTSWHLEYVYFFLVCREHLNFSLSETDQETARREIEQGEFLLRRGFSQTGLTERHLGRLHQLLGEWEEAIPYLNASRAKLSGSDLVAADQALFMSLIKTNRFEEARKLAEDGVALSGQYSALYRQLLEYLSE